MNGWNGNRSACKMEVSERKGKERPITSTMRKEVDETFEGNKTDSRNET